MVVGIVWGGQPQLRARIQILARPKCRHSHSIDRFGDVGGNAQQTVPMQTPHNRPQHDAMRMPSATAPLYVVNSAAGFTRGVWVPMGWHGGIGGGAPAEWDSISTVRVGTTTATAFQFRPYCCKPRRNAPCSSRVHLPLFFRILSFEGTASK